MSDVAMADGAPAPADAAPSPAVIESHVTPPNPVESAPREAKAEVADKPRETAADAIDRAMKKVEAQQKSETPKAEDKAPAKDTKDSNTAEPAAEKPAATRDETGRFASKEPVKTEAQPVKDAQPAQATEAQPTAQQPAKDAAQPARQPVRDLPARFSSDPQATADWETTPESVRHAVNRTVRELEGGIQKYKEGADEFERVRPFAEAAKRNGADLQTVLNRVVEFETAFQRNPIEGFQRVADHFGISLRQVAAHIMGQPQDQVATQNESVIRELRAELAQIKQQVGGVTETMQRQHQTSVQTSVEKFAADNPRFEELSDDIAFFIKSGRTNDLAEAYRLADLLNPAPAPVQPFAPPPAQRTASEAVSPPAEAQTLKGTKSISGAPSPGSDPTARRQPTARSPMEALERAFAAAGVR